MDLRRAYAASRIVAAILVVLAIGSLSARGENLVGYTRRVWQANNGLPEQTVQAFAQTADGYLWIGTTGGLLRFDGAHFVVFDRQNTPALHENSVFCLLVARDGALWIGTEGGGLVRYAHGQFRTWTTHDGLSNDFVRALVEDKDGSIWAGTDNGLLRIIGNRVERIDGTARIPALAVHGLWIDHTGALWAGGSSLLRITNGIAHEYSFAGEASRNRVKSILETQDGSVWVGTVSGLNRMAAGASHFVRVDGIASTVRVLRVTPDGTLWIGTIGEGAFALKNGKLTHLKAPGSLPSNTVLNFFTDSERNFWIGTQAGMLRLTEIPAGIVPLPEASDADFGTIYQDRDGSFWIASASLLHLQNGKIIPAVLPGMAGVLVRNLYRDRSGVMWAGTDGGGLFRIAGRRVQRFTTQEGLSNNFVRAMTQDRDGSMWVSTDEGLNHIIGAGDRLRIRSYQMRDGLAYFSTRVLLETRGGDLWIGTDRGLSHMHAGNFVSDAATDTLRQQKIWAIHEDGDGGLWFGTRDSGLYRFRNGSITHYTTSQGLASNAIYQILEDPAGHFWLSGPNGIALLNRHELDQQASDSGQQLALTLYSLSDLAGNTEIYGGTQSSGCITPQGDVWFPSNNGPIHISPAQRSLPPPPVRIQEIRVDGVPSVLRTAIRLRPGNTRLQIDYAPVRLRSQDGVRFRYRLEDFDKQWTAPTLERTASYTNLPPGRYRFRVEAFDIGDPTAVSETSTVIVQEPEFYRTWWFLAACVLLTALVVLAIHRLRVRQVRARLKAVFEERSRVAREMHDTVVQGCASVSALLEALSMNGSGDEQHRNLMDTARAQVRTTISEAREAIWNLRQDDGGGDGLGPKLTGMASHVSREFHVPVACSIAGNPFRVSQPTAHDLLMVAREAVYNSVLHGRPTQIDMRLHYDAHGLTLSVRDDGCGFDPVGAGVQNGHHFGLAGMRERVARSGGKFTLTTAPGRGVRIEVHLPRA